VNSSSRQDGSGGRRCSSQAATGRRWRSGNNGPMGMGGEGTDKTQGVGGGCKIKGEEGQGCQWRALCLALPGGTRSWRGTAGDCYRGGGDGNDEGGSTDKKLADLANVRQKETREDQDDADERGGRSPVRSFGNLDHGVTRGR
jgi:hypothetical protein